MKSRLRRTLRIIPPVILLAIVLVILLVIGALAWWFTQAGRDDGLMDKRLVKLERIRVSTAEQLSVQLEALDYRWPPQGPVPPIAVETLPDDLNEQRVQQKKSLFFRTLAPLIAAENAQLRQQRSFLLQAFADAGQLADPAVLEEIRKLAIHYKVAGEPDDPRFQRKLLTHVDVVPPGLVLAQAANESAWGTSRFALEANNLFGMWTWNAERGLEPLQRDPDATHYVRIYDDLRAAVRSYLFTINTGNAYNGLRQARAELRAAGKPLDPMILAGGLAAYSERGEAYVDEIRSIIDYNNLDDLYRFELRADEEAVTP